MCSPSAPDPRVTAGAQTGTNVATSIANSMLNNVNQVTPYGSLTYSPTSTYTWTDPASGSTYEVPIFTATQTLTPEGQVIQDNVMGAQTNMSEVAKNASGRLNDILGTGINLDNAPAAGTVPTMGTVTTDGTMASGNIANAGNIVRDYGTNFSQDRRRVEDAIMRRAQRGLDADKRALEARLADQGIEIGSAAYQSAMDDYNRGVNDMRTSAILAGGDEQSRLVGLAADRAQFRNDAQNQQFSQNATRADFRNDANQQNFANQLSATGFNNNAAAQNFDAQNQSRAQYLAEQYALRNQGINEITSLLNGSQVQNPNFINTQMANIPTTDYAGLVNQNYAQKQQRWSDLMGGIGGLFGGLPF